METDKELNSKIQKLESEKKQLESEKKQLESEKKQLESEVKNCIEKSEALKAKANTEKIKGQITIISTRKLTINGKSLQNKDVVKMPNNAETKRAIKLGLIKIIG